MKSVIAFAMILTSLTGLANTTAPTNDKCLKKVKRHYYLNGQKSDVPLDIRSSELLPAGKPLTDYLNKTIAVFETDKLIYNLSGSFHSGYFVDVIVVDPKTCITEEIINIYSE